MAPRLARTNAEAHLYMDLQPCEVCGERDFDPKSSVIMVDGDLASCYTGQCPRCHTEREFVFGLPEEILFPLADGVRFGDERPSELLDPGDWLWVADTITRNTPGDPAGLSADQRDQIRYDLATAVAAMDEVMKFIPPGAERVAEDAFFSPRGRAVYEAEPGRFRRLRLQAVRDAYQELVDAFTG